MNILIVGGNRFFGKGLLNKLSTKKDLNIYVINRGNRKIDKKILKKKNVHFLQCDRKNIKELKFNLSKIKFKIVFDNCAYNLRDVKNLLNIVGEQNIFYIFSSTVMSYLNLYLNRFLSESDWVKAKSIRNMEQMYYSHELTYARNKREIENFLIKNKKIKYIILRIHNVIGKSDFSKKTDKLFYSSLKNLKKYNIGEEDYFQFAYDKDLIKIIYKLILNVPKKSNIFNICNDSIKVEKFIKIKNRYSTKYKLLKDEKFPFPRNVIMKNNKIQRTLKFKFTPLKLVIKNISKKHEILQNN